MVGTLLPPHYFLRVSISFDGCSLPQLLASKQHMPSRTPPPLADMITACVDVEASFADPRSLSKPQICPDLPDAPPLPLPSLSDRGFPQLLTFLHTHLDSHLRAIQQADTFDEVFATFVVGPPDHDNAGPALHSHLVGCATTDPSTHHLALYVPVGSESPYKGPSDWAPLMVYLATSLLYPDLPFLVRSPDYVLGAQASILELRRCLGFSSTLNLFTTHTSLVGSDVLVHLPYPCQFNSHIAQRDPESPPLAPFSYNSPSDVLELIASLTKTHMATQIGIHKRIASGSVEADLYYALYCTPYYGFSPATSADFLVMVYQLSSFLIHCCYTFFLAQPNERLSIVGHLDASSIKIKKAPPAHAKHGNQTPKTNTTNTQHPQPNKETARAVGEVKKVRR